MKTKPLFLLLIIVLGTFGCQDDELPEKDTDNPPMVEQTTHTVKIIDSSFSPQHLTISTGDTVVWINQGGIIHTSTSGTDCEADGNWNSGNLSPEETFSFVFTSQGTFDYFCIPHCEMGMTGSVIVEE